MLGGSSCERILGAQAPLTRSPAVRQTDPQLPDASTAFPEGLFFDVKTAQGVAFIPASMEESDCYLDLAIGEQVVSAMVGGANTALARMKAGTSALEKVDEMLRGADAALAAPSAALASRLSSTDIGMFIEDTYRLQPPRSETPSPMQAAIYRDRIFRQTPSVNYVLVHFLIHRGVKLDLAAVRREFQAADRYVAPPKNFTSSSCKSGIEYQWPTMSGVRSSPPTRMLPQDTCTGVCARRPTRCSRTSGEALAAGNSRGARKGLWSV